jgi:hypothetical protein
MRSSRQEAHPGVTRHPGYTYHPGHAQVGRLGCRVSRVPSQRCSPKVCPGMMPMMPGQVRCRIGAAVGSGRQGAELFSLPTLPEKRYPASVGSGRQGAAVGIGRQRSAGGSGRQGQDCIQRAKWVQKPSFLNAVRKKTIVILPTAARNCEKQLTARYRPASLLVWPGFPGPQVAFLYVAGT